MTKYLALKILALLGTGVAILILGAVAFGPRIAERVALRELSPEMKEQYVQWKSKKLILPPQALDVRPFSPETQAAARAFRQEYKARHSTLDKVLTNYFKNNPRLELLGKEERPDLAAARGDLDHLQPLLNAFERLVTQPDFEFNATVGDQRWMEGDYIRPIPFFLPFHNATKLTILKALVLAQEGKMAEALHAAEVSICGSRPNPYGSIIGQLVGVMACSPGAIAWQEVVRQCGDPGLLRHTLARQNELAGQLRFFSENLPITALDNLDTIRECKRRGLPVSLPPLTERELIAKSYEAEADYLEKITLPAQSILSPTATQKEKAILAFRISGMQESILSYRTSAAMYGGVGNYARPWRIRLALPWLSAVFFTQGRQTNTFEFQIRVRVAQSRFDLLRLETARKLYALEHGGAAPARLADLVPQYLPEIPLDRFAQDKKAPYREAANCYYSIGPNGKDEGARIFYDPTNGTTSGGDVALVR